MDGPTLTLRQAAEQLGVHYMTAYRYVRLGMLPARKVGAAWVVEPDDLAAMAAPDESAPRSGRPADWSGRLEARLVAGDERGAWGVVEAALASGLDPEGVYEDLLAPVMTRIGDRWESRDIDVADEHRASAVASRIIGRLGPRFARRGRSRGTVVTATPSGDLHGLGLAVVADLLRGARYEVVDLGPNTPAASLGKAVAEAPRLVAVAISLHAPGAEAELAEAIAAVRAADPSVPVIVGGCAIEGDQHAESLGADGYAATGREAVGEVDRLASG